MFLDNLPAPQNITLNSTVLVKVENGTEATVVIPPEIRLTQNLLALLKDAVSSQGFQLTHMEISKEHVQELGNLKDVVLRQEETTK